MKGQVWREVTSRWGRGGIAGIVVSSFFLFECRMGYVIFIYVYDFVYLSVELSMGVLRSFFCND